MGSIMPASLRRRTPPPTGEAVAAPELESRAPGTSSNALRAAGKAPEAEVPDQVAALAGLMGLEEDAPQATAQEATSTQAKPAQQAASLGAWDSMSALWGGLHLSKVLPADAGVKFDGSNKDANYLNYDVWGKDRAKVPALRIASMANGELSTGAVSADGSVLEQQGSTRGKDGSTTHSARMVIPTATARAVKHTGLDISADAVRVQGVSAERSYTHKDWAAGFFSAPGATAVSVGGVSVEGLKVGGVAIEDLSAQQLAATVDSTSASATVETATARGVQLDGGSIAQVTATGARATGALDGSSASAQLARAEATGVDVGGVTAAQVTGKELSAQQDARSTRLSAQQLDATTLRSGGSSAKDARLTGVQASLTPDALTASAAKLQANGLQHQQEGLDVKAATFNAEAVQLQTGAETTLRADQAEATQVEARTTAAPGAATDPNLMPQLADRVGSADVRARLGLRPATLGEGLGAATIRPGTVADARLKVQNSRLDPAGTRVGLNQPIDTFGWTSVHGASLTPKGEVIANVEGWADKNVTPDLGLRGVGDSMPLGVGDIARRLPAPSAGPSLTTSVEAQGRVGLTPGTITTEGVQAKLGAGNQADVSYTDKAGQTQLGVSVARLLLDSLGVQAGGASLQVDGATAEDVKHDQRSDASGTQTTTSAGSVKTGKVEAKSGG
jgi:hypothetical protein